MKTRLEQRAGRRKKRRRVGYEEEHEDDELDIDDSDVKIMPEVTGKEMEIIGDNDCLYN